MQVKANRSDAHQTLGLGRMVLLMVNQFTSESLFVYNNNKNTISLKAKKYSKHTHCLHLAKAIRGRLCGYSTYLKTCNKENK